MMKKLWLSLILMGLLDSGSPLMAEGEGEPAASEEPATEEAASEEPATEEAADDTGTKPAKGKKASKKSSDDSDKAAEEVDKPADDTQADDSGEKAASGDSAKDAPPKPEGLEVSDECWNNAAAVSKLAADKKCKKILNQKNIAACSDVEKPVFKKVKTALCKDSAKGEKKGKKGKKEKKDKKPKEASE